MPVRRLISGALALAILAPVPMAVAAAKVTMVGPWRILSGASSAGLYCTMQLGTVTTKVVGIQVRTNGKTFMSVGDPGWTLTPQTPIPTKVVIDGKPLFDGQAIAVMPNIVVIPLPDDSNAVEIMSAGKSLTATVDKGSVTYDLGGAPAARDALKSCLDAA